MIPIMKVTTKGQITIPEKIREWFHLLPGTNVEFLP
jgi:AbrB family looped-hinge helix DNA binding protein